MGSHWAVSTPGSIIMPTETKKTAPKRFLTGCSSFSIATDSAVSASSDPITKAPSADENPAFTAIITMPRQSPSATMSSVSSSSVRRSLRSRFGSR